jgi:5-methylcytosine-specific restriction endonuclease McrA
MTDDYGAQWRASSHEAVQYSEDLPECFLVLPEPIDGAVAQGCATKITISINLGEKNSITITDNGKGITNTERLLTWASKTSTDVHHRYGHGSKKFLSKWNKNYNCKWYVRFRTCDKKKRSGSLFTYNGPFKGPTMMADEDEIDETILMPSGLEWYIEFDIATLGSITTPQKIFDVVKELLRTRYSRKYFDKTEFIINISQGDVLLTESSKLANWKTFQECIQDEVLNGNASIIHQYTVEEDGLIMKYNQYEFTVYGKSKEYTLNKEFPIFGHKNQACTRLHIALEGRTIELAPVWKFYSGKGTSHNSINGRFAFVNFEGDYTKMPTPCTTKVSFYENCPNYIKYISIIKDHNDLPECKCVPKKEEKKEEKKPIIKLKKETQNIVNIIKDISNKEPPVEKPKEEKLKEEKPKEEKPKEENPKEEIKPKQKIPAKVRNDVWNTYIGHGIAQHKCLCCKKTTIHNTEFECGHVKSEAKNGGQEITNLRPICSSCNKSMGTTNMIEFVKKHGYYIG